MTVDADVATTTDKVLGGAVTLVQPASGAHRSGSDAVFLGSTLDDGSGLTLDLGAGCGAVGLVAAHRNPNLRVTLVET
ncbi:MAG: methyltransferase, partial [Devosiaceae bacterium]|nr:methyltransferase [Devosiaceae bacterium MH13]